MGISTSDAFLKELQRRGREGQKSRRAQLRQGLEPDVEDALGSAINGLRDDVRKMPVGERHWRVIGGALWWDALAGDPGLADMATWLGGSIKAPSEISRDDWMAFWCLHIDPLKIPAFVLYMLTELHQTDSGIELSTSNAFDAIHASYLLDVDALISRDLNFLKVLDHVRADAPFTFARTVVFDDSMTSHAQAFQTALVEARKS